jgi:hypothetical protein
MKFIRTSLLPTSPARFSCLLGKKVRFKKKLVLTKKNCSYVKCLTFFVQTVQNLKCLINFLQFQTILLLSYICGGKVQLYLLLHLTIFMIFTILFYLNSRKFCHLSLSPGLVFGFFLMAFWVAGG